MHILNLISKERKQQQKNKEEEEIEAISKKKNQFLFKLNKFYNN